MRNPWFKCSLCEEANIHDVWVETFDDFLDHWREDHAAYHLQPIPTEVLRASRQYFKWRGPRRQEEARHAELMQLCFPFGVIEGVPRRGPQLAPELPATERKTA